jgi:hypothetical protein
MGALWLVVAVSGQAALADGLAGRVNALRVIAIVGAALLWAVVFAALAICCAVSLTTLRMICPLAVVMAALTGLGGASATAWATMALAALVTMIIAFSADVGATFVQGSAYGAERRFALRPPAVALVVPVVWVTAVSVIVLAVLALDRSWWVAGLLALVAGTALLATLGRAAHQLSRRWLVLVPAGVVVHDPVMLADNAMFPRSAIRGAALATVGTVALDATGGSAGIAIELAFAEPMTIALAGRPGRPGARTVDARAILVAPTRPGRFLDAAAAHRLATGSARTD